MGLVARIRSLSVVIKLPAMIAAVVMFTTMAVVAAQHVVGKEFARRAAKGYLQRYLTHTTDILEYLLARGVDRDLAVAAAVCPPVCSGAERGCGILGCVLDEQGRILFGGKGRLLIPPQRLRAMVPLAGRGIRELEVEGKKVVVGWSQLDHWGLVVVGQLDPDQLLWSGIRQLETVAMQVALGVGVLIVAIGVWVAHRELASPLKYLAAEAERVAEGDLVPPEVDEQRRDELGRLGKALAAMTRAAAAMVADAKAHQERFAQLFTEAREGVVIADRAGRILEANPAAREMFAWKEQLPEKVEELFVHPAQYELYEATLGAVGYVQNFGATLKRADGSWFEALVSASSPGDKEGYQFLVVRDVTEMLKVQQALKDSEERYRRLVESLPDVVYRWDVEARRFDYINPAIEMVTGYSPQRFIDEPELLRRVIHPAHRQRVLRHWDSCIRGEVQDYSELEYPIVDANGRVKWVRERTVAVRGRTRAVQALEGIVTDITAQRELAEAYRQGQQMVEAVLQGMPVAVMVLERDHRVAHWNKAMENLTGVKAEEVVGTTEQWKGFYPSPRPVLADLVLEEDNDAIVHYYGDKGLKRSTLIEGALEAEDYLALGKGQGRWVYFMAAPIRDERGRIVRAVETLLDMTDRRRLEEELRRLSVTDELTGLYNQRFFYATLAREVEIAKRYLRPLSLLMLDLDHFKHFNDRYGHMEGDRALAKCAQVMRSKVRGSDLVCRYGGEEFAIILPQTSLEEARMVAERIRQDIAATEFEVSSEGRTIKARLTISIGVAGLTERIGMQELVRRADRALYHAKAAGRNRVAVFRDEGDIEI